MTSQLDHLVLAVPHLDQGVRDLAARTGVQPVPGGSHPGMGTHNALVGLRWRGSERCYLELIAPDPAQPDVPAEDTMLGLGLLGPDFAPRLLTWAVRPEDLSATLDRARQAEIDAGQAAPASRVTGSGERLSWWLAVPSPPGLGGVQPFLISWDGDTHPADSLVGTLELVGLELHHPDPTRVRRHLDALEVDLPVTQGERPSLRATMIGPHGEVVLT